MSRFYEEDKRNIEQTYAQAQKAVEQAFLGTAPDENDTEEDIKQKKSVLAQAKQNLAKVKDYRNILLNGEEAERRRAVILHNGLDTLFQAIKDDYQDCANSITEDASDDDKYWASEYQKLVDNFDVLVQGAMEQVQYFENFRIIPYKRKDSTRFEGDIKDSQEENLRKEEDFTDDEAGTKSTGNDGWSFKIRFVDPRLSVSQYTKKILWNVPFLDENGEPVRDDLGYARFINAEWAHAVLINELSNMVDDDDFYHVEKDADGNIIKESFPALERMQYKYPWAKSIITILKNNPHAIGAFYHDFDLPFIPYAKIDWNGTHMALNDPIAGESMFATLIKNYENGIVLSNTPVYNTNGLVRRNAQSLSGQWREMAQAIDEFLHDDYDTVEDLFKSTDVRKNIPQTMANTLRSLGFNVKPEYIKNFAQYLFLPTHGRKGKEHSLWDKLEEEVRIILAVIADKEKGLGKGYVIKDSDHYVKFFQGRLKHIAQIIGNISETDNVQSFREGEDTRYSYSAPNYIINMVKKLKSADYREYIEKEFGNDPWFRDKDGNWKNEWLRLLYNDRKVGRESYSLRDELRLCEIINVSEGTKDKNEKIPYADWNKDQTYEVMFAEYFRHTTSGLASYIMPIFSDTPTCMAITMKRFTRDTNEERGTDENPSYYSKLGYKSLLIPHLVDVVLQEAGRIKLVQQRKEGGASPIQNFDKKGLQFQFFPELNNYILPDGYYVDVAQELIDRGDVQELRELTAEVIDNIMDSLFAEFLQDINYDKAAQQLITLKAVPSEIVKAATANGRVDYNNADLQSCILDSLEEFFWNHTFAISQIIQLTTTDLAYYKNPVDFQKRFKETYAAGRRLCTNTRYGRKIENTIYIADNIITASRYTGLKKSLQNTVNAGRMEKSQMEWILSQAKNINVADAQAFRNPYAFRAVLDMMGRWNDDMESSFRNFLNGTWDFKDFNIIWQSIKPFMFSNISVDNGVTNKNSEYYGKKMRVPHQNKNSEFVVLAFFDLIAAGSEQSDVLKGLGEFFMKHSDIDVIQFESAVKAGGQGIVNINFTPDVLEEKIAAIDEKDFVEKGRIEARKQGLNYDKLSSYDKFKVYNDWLLDNNRITQEEYNNTFSDTEPTPDEVIDMLEEAIAPKDENGNPTGQELDIENDIFDHNVVHQLYYADYMIAQPTPEHLMDEEDATSGSQFRYLILANLPEDFTIELKGMTLNKKQIFDLYRGAMIDNLLDSYEDTVGIFGDIHKLQHYIFQAIQGNPKYGTDIIEALQIVKVPNPKEPGQMMEVFNLPLDLPTITNQVQELLTSLFKNRVTKQKINGGNCIQVACCGLTKKLNLERDDNGKITAAQCMLPAWTKKFYKNYLKKGRKLVHSATGGSDHYEDYEYLDLEKIERECPDLLKMIGYRIPTENKYSMLPLKVVGFLPQQNGSSIMLPADITLIAGSDFDVDKMYLRIPNIDDAYYKKTNGKVRKLDYDLSDLSTLTKEGKTWKATGKDRMTKKQRDNLMIDIEYAVLTSSIGSEQIYKPGNFDELKRQARIATVLADENLLLTFIQKFGNIDTNNNMYALQDAAMDAKAVLDILHQKDSTGNYIVSLSALDDFLAEYEPVRNSLIPQTYNYFHTQNMTGKALVGVYANGSSMHSKGQETSLRLNKGEEIKINGRTLNSLHEQRRKKLVNGQLVDAEYIQDNMAQFQAASVDNAKDPVLATLFQSMFTAGNTILMVRLGMSLEEIALLYNVIKYGNFTDEQLLGAINSIQKDLGITDDFTVNEIPVVTSENMLQAQMYIRKYPRIYNALKDYSATDSKAKRVFYAAVNEAEISKEELMDMLSTLFRTNNLYNHISYLRRNLKPVNDILKADSPNNAIDITLSGAIRQRRAVDLVKMLFDKGGNPYRGKTNYSTDTVKEFIRNGVILASDSREEMKSRLMNETLNYVQAFYSLGIELPLRAMQDYFIQGSDDLQLLADRLMNNSETGLMEPRQINTLYREFMQFVLTNTKTFGNDGEHTFDEKREYYLYYFPKRDNFLKKVNSIKELRENNTIKRMTSFGDIYPTIKLPRSGKMTPVMKASIRRDLASLLYSKNPEVVKFAKDLFLYSFYHDGFNFKSESFGTYFDSTYWNAFPEVINYLRTFKYNAEYNGLMNKFEEQWLANHAKEDIIKTYKSRQHPPIFNEDGTLSLRKGNCFTTFSQGEPLIYVRAKRSKGSKDYRIYILDRSSLKDATKPDSYLTYVPMPTFDEPDSVYNANSNASTMEEAYWNDRRTLIEQKKEKDKKEREARKKNTPKIDTSDDTAAEDSPSADALAAVNRENDTDDQNAELASTFSTETTDTDESNAGAIADVSEEDADSSWIDDNAGAAEQALSLLHKDEQLVTDEDMKVYNLQKSALKAQNTEQNNNIENLKQQIASKLDEENICKHK